MGEVMLNHAMPNIRLDDGAGAPTLSLSLARSVTAVSWHDPSGESHTLGVQETGALLRHALEGLRRVSENALKARWCLALLDTYASIWLMPQDDGVHLVVMTDDPPGRVMDVLMTPEIAAQWSRQLQLSAKSPDANAQ